MRKEASTLAFKFKTKQMKLLYVTPLILVAVACQNPESSSTTNTNQTQNDSSVAIFTDSLIQPQKDSESTHLSLKLTVSSHEEDRAGKEHDQIDLAEIKAHFKHINSIDYWDSLNHIAFDKDSTIVNADFYYQDRALQKVLVLSYSPSYEHFVEYYLFEGQPSLIIEKRRDLPFHKENETVETRSYFKNGELVRQINNQDCGSPFAADYLVEEQLRMVIEWEQLLERYVRK